MRSACVSGCLLVLVWLLFGTSPALGAGLAQSATATPSPSWEPLFPSSTPVPTRSYECSQELPQSWGTVTPSLLWSSSCSNCLLTLTPRATSTSWFPSATPDPSASPAPTNTATATPHVPPLDVYLDDAEWLDNSGYAGSEVNSQAFDSYTAIFDATQTNTLTGPTSPWSSSAWWVSFAGAEPNDVLKFTISGSWYTQWDGGQSGDCGSFILGLPSGHSLSVSGTPGSYCTYELTLPAYLGGWGATQSIGFGNFRGPNTAFTDPAYQHQGGFIFQELNGVPVGLATATPTATPVLSYCSSVDGSLPSAEPDLGIALPVITVGEAVCTGLGEITIPFSILNLIGDWEFSDLVIPGIEICFRPVSFGVLDLFGVLVDLDLMVLLMSGALVLRWFLRS